MTSLLANSRRSHVGGWLYRRVALRSNERVIMEDRCLYRLSIGWCLGKLFLTNMRVIWCPGRDFPQIFFSPRAISLTEITNVDIAEESFTSNLIMPKRWRIETGSTAHYFSDGWGPFPQSTRRDEWVVGIREAIGA
jgi:hypothetical protein